MRRLFPLFWLVILFLVAAFVATAEASSRFEIKQMVISEATTSRVPVSLALAVAKVESDFNAKALSSAGARGVMQIMPATARGEFGVSPQNLWNPTTNIRLGIQFLEKLHTQYGGRWELALSHYNGGTIKGNKVHNYTKKYVQMVQKWQRVYQEQANLWDGGDNYERIDDKDEVEVAQLQEWIPRSNGGFEEVDYGEDEQLDEDWGETKIIIVERSRPDQGWRRPPPPPRHRDFDRPPPRGYGRPPPRGYFH